MDIWQLKRQLAFLLATAIWADAPSALVFTGGAFVSEDLDGNFLPGNFLPDGPVVKSGTDATKGITPFARVSCTGFDVDAQSPSAGRLSIASLKAWSTVGGGGVAAPGNWASDKFDTHGLNLVGGKLRDTVQGQGKSQGRDVDEVALRFIEFIGGDQLQDRNHGMQALVSAGDVIETVDGVQALKRAILVDVFNGTVSRYYHPCFNLTLTTIGQSAGSILLIWGVPPLRFDTRRYVLRRGASPNDPAPLTIADGVGVPLSGLVASVVASGLVTMGVYYFSLFVTYDETGSSTDERISAAVNAHGAAA